ncbi:ParB-like chromosome segregation protein Spo0J [Kitasatospora sp. MAA4]|uniref:ParB N-terminal domain-containing protein n=1 Tax=Kitasatospora sp. MAA4 TaxID=3035093 RepID=UPI00247676BB|nr:ParB N-terminal domain-containing protein [Kitasatospora sp. MAA4]MDH6132929.1 ParB-like chromosome segregation protein Spo0J [Kitasatospora sp. MAA4]
MNTRQRAVDAAGENSDYLIALRDKGLRDLPVELVRLDGLTIVSTPRVAGEDLEYARTLAETEAALPPITVHRATMKVVDGVHRVRAAALRGQEHIDARFFDGNEEDAYLLSVAMNVAQGRPLSLDDRVAAVTRILTSHPQWSDRAVASIAGLSAPKVAEVRRRLGDGQEPGATRIGRDGRARPLNCAHARTLASQLIRENPEASLRQIGKKAGISPATVADVRDRMLRGDDPVPSRQRVLASVEPLPRRKVQHAEAGHAVLEMRSPAELLSMFDALRRDPSLRFNESGRTVLRMLEACALVARDQKRIASVVPVHCKGPMSELMRGFSDVWKGLADALKQDEFVEAESG